MLKLGEFGRNSAEGLPLAGLGVAPAEPLGQGHDSGCGIALRMPIEVGRPPTSKRNETPVSVHVTLPQRDITGPFETWREGISYACMRGDIERTAGLTVKEPDRGAIAFARWNAFPSSPVEVRTRKDNDPGTGEPAESIACLRSNRRVLLQAAE
jgi:hypothetical protein